MNRGSADTLLWAACDIPEAGLDGHIVPSSIKALGTLEKSDSEVCCEPQLPAPFDGYSGNSPFAITPFFLQSNQFSNTHTLHTKLISGMALWDLLQIQMVQWSVFDEDQHMMQLQDNMRSVSLHTMPVSVMQLNLMPYSDQHSASLCSSGSSLCSPKRSRSRRQLAGQ